MQTQPTTLRDHLAGQCTRDLADTLARIAQSCSGIAVSLQLEAARGSGGAGSRNVHGEWQQQADLLANDLMIECLQGCDAVAAAASEELEQALTLRSDGRYAVAFDPLDGSANFAMNLPVGTIFSVLPYVDSAERSFLQSGRHILAAGFTVYGPLTLLVLGVGDGVHLYRYDTRRHMWLWQEVLSIPAQTDEFSINGGHFSEWDRAVQRYIMACSGGAQGPHRKAYKHNYVGSMVADMYRVFKRGGIFLNPARQAPGQDRAKAKLRLLYEVAPMSWLVEHAGGMASSGTEALLDIEPTLLHQTAATALGSREEVERLCAYYREQEA